MVWLKEADPNQVGEGGQQEPPKRTRPRSIPRSMVVDFKESKYGTSRNPFINFLTEFKKITPNLKLSGAQLAKVGGEMWREMNRRQKSQFQTVEAKRRRRKKKGGRRRRRRQR